MRRGAQLIAAFLVAVAGCTVTAATAAVPDARHEPVSEPTRLIAPVTCRDDCDEPRYYAPRYDAPRYYEPGYHEPRYYGPPVNPYPMPSYRYGPPPLLYAPPPVLVPERPLSCGRYRYWNGERCADARFEPPYVGPKW